MKTQNQGAWPRRATGHGTRRWSVEKPWKGGSTGQRSQVARARLSGGLALRTTHSAQSLPADTDRLPTPLKPAQMDSLSLQL